jgi:hypothetical protein
MTEPIKLTADEEIARLTADDQIEVWRQISGSGSRDLHMREAIEELIRQYGAEETGPETKRAGFGLVVRAEAGWVYIPVRPEFLRRDT